MTPWWDASQAGWIGGALGTMGGLMGAAIGTLCGIFAPRGLHRGLVLGFMKVDLAAGICALTIGGIALAFGQPYHVWYPVILFGGIMTAIIGANFPVIRKVYQQAEARKLGAEEFRRGA